MPTIIALDISLSMTRPLPNSPHSARTSGDDEILLSSNNYHQLAISGINSLLDYLNHHSRMEFVSLVSFFDL